LQKLKERYINKFNQRKISHIWGIIAEYICAFYILLKGYSIVKLRYNNRFGEIDIIAVDKKTLIFFEVKARKNFANAIASVTPAKRKKIELACEGFRAQNLIYSGYDIRFDVLVITPTLRILHIKQAW